jgi:hypothetical protein
VYVQQKERVRVLKFSAWTIEISTAAHTMESEGSLRGSSSKRLTEIPIPGYAKPKATIKNDSVSEAEDAKGTLVTTLSSSGKSSLNAWVT